jgi:hypothetical protein
VYPGIVWGPVQRPFLVALVAATAAALPAAALAGAIDLRITYRASETAAPKVLTLSCDGAVPTGTVTHPVAACRKLHAIGDQAFARTPRGMGACAMLYGGPMTAVVSGIYYGQRVWAKLTRVDGCAIARWNRVGFLFPAAPGAKPGKPPGS